MRIVDESEAGSLENLEELAKSNQRPPKKADIEEQMADIKLFSDDN